MSLFKWLAPPPEQKVAAHAAETKCCSGEYSITSRLVGLPVFESFPKRFRNCLKLHHFRYVSTYQMSLVRL